MFIYLFDKNVLITKYPDSLSSTTALSTKLQNFKG